MRKTSMNQMTHNVVLKLIKRRKKFILTLYASPTSKISPKAANCFGVNGTETLIFSALDNDMIICISVCMLLPNNDILELKLNIICLDAFI